MMAQGYPTPSFGGGYGSGGGAGAWSASQMPQQRPPTFGMPTPQIPMGYQQRPQNFGMPTPQIPQQQQRPPMMGMPTPQIPQGYGGQQGPLMRALSQYMPQQRPGMNMGGSGMMAQGYQSPRPLQSPSPRPVRPPMMY